MSGLAAPADVLRSVRPQDPAAARALAGALGVPHAVGRVLAARGMTDPEEARAHLRPDPGRLHDPFRMAGVPEAVDRLLGTARRGGRVVVFGDYDCDGVGALAILLATLRRLGADAQPFIPHRIRDGYGLRLPTLLAALERFEPEGIVTVDCGITAVEPVVEAVRRGVYVVVTDHHIPPAALPEGAVLVDPKLPGCSYPFKDLAGAGIAWKLSAALLTADGGRVGMAPSAREAWLGSLAKVAALSTIADVVPLTGENRVLTAWGLAGLAGPRSPGLAALLARSGVPEGRSPSAREVAFQVAPRLNASGRIDHAHKALDLLLTPDPAVAAALADELEATNAERRELQRRVVEAALERLERSFDPERDALVVEAGRPEEGWHRGVLGIAATRLAQEVRRPVLLFSTAEGRAAGSGRTWGRVPLYDRLRPVALRHATDFGGHAAALGVTVPEERFDAFRREALAAFSAARSEDEWRTELVADTELDPSEVDRALTDGLALLEPHGAGNPKALFLLRGLRWDGRGRRVGPRGLRIAMRAGGVRLDGVGWELAEEQERFREAVGWDVLANVALDRVSGRPELNVLHVCPAGTA